ncbi:MAG: hypothetical protein D6776_04910 [Planctomycetota bacterium]|nr:MAG: hypothetical protein D6776_04910 [Planctomycetota bacterium]
MHPDTGFRLAALAAAVVQLCAALTGADPWRALLGTVLAAALAWLGHRIAASLIGSARERALRSSHRPTTPSAS